jgi:hypothetical protein
MMTLFILVLSVCSDIYFSMSALVCWLGEMSLIYNMEQKISEKLIGSFKNLLFVNADNAKGVFFFLLSF